MVKVTAEQLKGEELEKAVDQDIERFGEWFRSLGNDPLVRSEKAVLKTYLFYKTRVPGSE